MENRVLDAPDILVNRQPVPDALINHRSRLSVQAPFAGTLLDLPRNDNGTIRRGDVIAVIEQQLARQIIAYLTQDEALKIGLHDEATVYAPSLGLSVTARVVRIDRNNAWGALRAIDAATGQRKWEFRYPSPTMAGVMSTAAGLVFAGDHEGNFMAFDSRTGRNLWRYSTGTPIWGAAAMTYLFDGRQFVLIPSGTTLLAFALPSQP